MISQCPLFVNSCFRGGGGGGIKKIAIIVLIRNPRNLENLFFASPELNSSNHISSQTVSRTEPKLDGKNHSDIEIQNC